MRSEVGDHHLSLQGARRADYQSQRGLDEMRRISVFENAQAITNCYLDRTGVY